MPPVFRARFLAVALTVCLGLAAAARADEPDVKPLPGAAVRLYMSADKEAWARFLEVKANRAVRYLIRSQGTGHAPDGRFFYARPGNQSFTRIT